jgi:hypothetical protein
MSVASFSRLARCTAPRRTCRAAAGAATNVFAATYALIIKGGRVIDPSEDVANCGAKIARRGRSPITGDCNGLESTWYSNRDRTWCMVSGPSEARA